MISGGRPDDVTGLGHAGVNESLGSRWRTRVAALDDYVHSVAGSIPV
ncbi:polymorphic toxin type 15 domain-containing protein [Frigoribacterium sp. R86507]